MVKVMGKIQEQAVRRNPPPNSEVAKPHPEPKHPAGKPHTKVSLIFSPEFQHRLDQERATGEGMPEPHHKPDKKSTKSQTPPKKS